MKVSSVSRLLISMWSGLDMLFIQGEVHKYLEPAQGLITTNLYNTAREELKFAVRTVLNHIATQNQDFTSRPMEMPTNGEVQTVKLAVKPCEQPDLWWVIFEESPPEPKETRPKHRRSSRPSKATAQLQEELDQTRQTLQATVLRHDTFSGG